MTELQLIVWTMSLIILDSFVVFGNGETTWVWNTNRTPHSSNTENIPTSSLNPNYGQTNFGRDRVNKAGGGRQSIFPESPSRPSSSSSKDNSALPEDSIRVINNGQGNSEARLIPGAANFVSNALQSISGGGSGGGGGNSAGGGLFNIGGSLLGSIFQSVPQIAGSALEILLGRPSKGNSGSSSSASSKPSSSNGATTLPASGSSFPVLSPGSSSSSGGGRPSSGNDNTDKSPPASSGGGGCKCIPLNSCFLPSRPGASCAGGNIMCCQTSTRLGPLDDALPQNIRNTKDTNSVKSPSPSQADIRIGLLENIVKGSSNVVDDALDFLLQRYYTEEDQRRLATRVLKSS